MKRIRIARFEEIVQHLVEGTFARLFAGRLRPVEVANALARALEDDAVSRPGSLPRAPNHYWVALHPEDHQALLEQQPDADLARDLARYLVDLANELGYALPDSPVVNLEPDPDVPLHQLRVRARWVPLQEVSTDEGGTTRQMSVSAYRTRDPSQASSTRPFLIIEGQRHVTLVNSTVSLGRSFRNDIILDDARVSRRHAQLRRRYGRYIVYDLGSTGGTMVNGYPVQECMLEAGDVISLAGVEIIYGEDTTTAPTSSGGTTDTPAMRPSALSDTGPLPSRSSNPPES
jgi:hypothetical protein